MSIEIAGVRKIFQTKMSGSDKAAVPATVVSSSSASAGGGLSSTTPAVNQNLFATPAHQHVQSIWI